MPKAGVLVFDNFNNKILTISNQFDENIGLPKGECDETENIYDTEFRELSEETGLEFTIRPKIKGKFRIKFQNITIFIVELPNGSLYDFSPDDEIKINENIYNIKWRTYNDLIYNFDKLNFTLKKNNKKKNKIFQPEVQKLFVN